MCSVIARMSKKVEVLVLADGKEVVNTPKSFFWLAWCVHILAPNPFQV